LQGPARLAGAASDAIRAELDSGLVPENRFGDAHMPIRPVDVTKRVGDQSRPVLDGIKVLDLCIVLAGPTCGRTLAEFGADVIRIDSPRVKTVLRHNDINRGKRSVLIDLKTKEGLEIFWKLVDRSDVLLQNFRRGVAEKL